MGTSTIMTLFGPEQITKINRFRLRSIQATFKTEIVREDAPEWLTKSVSSANAIFEMFKDLSREAKEHFISLHLDNKNKILCIDRVSVGSLTASVVHPREVFKTALLSSAAGVVFIHNHPSGDPEPSREDLDITTRLKQCGELLGIRILDHVIIGENRYCSFSDRGYL